MAPPRCPLACPHIPGAALSSQPLQDLQVASLRCRTACPRIPGTALSSQPLQDLQVASPRCRTACPAVPGAALSPQPVTAGPGPVGGAALHASSSQAQPTPRGKHLNTYNMLLPDKTLQRDVDYVSPDVLIRKIDAEVRLPVGSIPLCGMEWKSSCPRPGLPY